MAKDDEQPQSSWVFWALVAAAVGLGVLLVIAAVYLMRSHTPVCDTSFPARRGAYPSWVYVFAAVAAFVLGSLTATIGIKRQGRSQQELGEGQWSSQSAVVAVNLGVAIFLFVVTILMVIEAWTLGHGVWPITYYVRCANDAGPFISLVAVASFAYIIGRWMWVFKD